MTQMTLLISKLAVTTLANLSVLAYAHNLDLIVISTSALQHVQNYLIVGTAKLMRTPITYSW